MSPAELGDLSIVLRELAGAADVAGAEFSNPRARMVSSLIGAGLRLSAELAAQGRDPLQGIGEIHSVVAGLKDADASIEEALRKKFGW